MPTASFTRRQMLWIAAAAPALANAAAIRDYGRRSTVALVKGEQRRRIVHDSIVAIDEQIKPLLKRKKYVLIKPNNVSTVNQLASTHADTLHGILDYLSPRTKLPVVIAESSAGTTMEGFQNFKYPHVASEHKRHNIKLIDLNEEAKYNRIGVLDENLHITPVRLAARLMDPDALVICAAIMKTHNAAVATLSVKNMTLGAPLRNAPKESPRWNDKRKYHTGVRQTHYNMLLTAQALQPYWNVTLIDGYEGMEGNGPASGTPVASRIAIASTDYIAADRVAVEAMGIDPKWVGYLIYCGDCGVGNYDMARIDVRGEKIADVMRKYRLHKDIDRELQWMGPMTDLPPKLG
jgi:uncharacterized protein (DUF362 family)